MNNRDFDQRMRKRASQEKTDLTPRAEERFLDALESARTAAPVRDRSAMNGWKLAALPWVAAGIIMLLLIPHADVTEHGFVSRTEQPEIHAAQAPYAQAPQVYFDAGIIKEEARVDGSFRNDTKETWLIAWRSAGQERLLWLEPGAECTDSILWQADEHTTELAWEYCGYRVTAGILHWVEGDVLAPGTEGYEQQQDLMREAVDAGALILAAGDWRNGKAGPVQLPLPQGSSVEDVLLYYEEKGALTDASALLSGEGKTHFEKRNFLPRPSADGGEEAESLAP